MNKILTQKIQINQIKKVLFKIGTYDKMAVGPTKTGFSTMRKQSILCNTVFFSKCCLLCACYMLVEPLKKKVFPGGENFGKESLPKWQTKINSVKRWDETTRGERERNERSAELRKPENERKTRFWILKNIDGLPF